MERDRNGKLLSTAKCVECTENSQPSWDGTICQPCLFHPVLETGKNSCNCSLIGGLCLPANYRNEGGHKSPTSKDSYVYFPSSGKNVDSAFFKEHFEAAVYMCSVSSHVSTHLDATSAEEAHASSTDPILTSSSSLNLCYFRLPDI